MESSKMVQSLIGLRTLSQNWFRHFVAFQWNESDLCWLWCWFMRWDNLLLVKYSDLHTLSNVSTWSRFTHFLVFWLDLAIYALCRILMKCRDLRIFPGTNYRFPGTKNFSTPLSDGHTWMGDLPKIYHHCTVAFQQSPLSQFTSFHCPCVSMSVWRFWIFL